MSGEEDTSEVASMFDEVLEEKKQEEAAQKLAQASEPVDPMNPMQRMTEHFFKQEEAPTEFDPSEEVIDLTNLRLKAFDDVKNLAQCTALEQLIFRQNLMTDLKGLEALAPTLTSLDCYENKLKASATVTLAQLPNLTWLDLSFNSLRGVAAPLSNLPELRELYLISNKITELKNLTNFPNLKLLELGDNRIRTIQNLDALPALQELYLGRNKITQIQGLDALANLRIMSLQSNRIITIEGLSACTNLEELYLSHNGITVLQGVEGLPKLRVLDVGNNRLTEVSGLSNVASLEEFWCNRNFIEDMETCLNVLQGLPLLNTLYLEHNPLQTNPDYKRVILRTLPLLTQLDAETYIPRDPAKLAEEDDDEEDEENDDDLPDLEM